MFHSGPPSIAILEGGRETCLRQPPAKLCFHESHDQPHPLHGITCKFYVNSSPALSFSLALTRSLVTGIWSGVAAPECRSHSIQTPRNVLARDEAIGVDGKWQNFDKEQPFNSFSLGIYQNSIPHILPKEASSAFALMELYNFANLSGSFGLMKIPGMGIERS